MTSARTVFGVTVPSTAASRAASGQTQPSSRLLVGHPGGGAGGPGGQQTPSDQLCPGGLLLPPPPGTQGPRTALQLDRVWLFISQGAGPCCWVGKILVCVCVSRQLGYVAKCSLTLSLPLCSQTSEECVCVCFKQAVCIVVLGTMAAVKASIVPRSVVGPGVSSV